MQPHDAAVGQLAQLDEVAQLVGEPEAPAAGLAERGARAAGERLRRRSGRCRGPRRSRCRPRARRAGRPRPPPWRTLLVATSWTASTRSSRALLGEPGALAPAPPTSARSVGERVARDRGARPASAGRRRAAARRTAAARVGRRGSARARRAGHERVAERSASAITSRSSCDRVVGADQVEARGVGERDVEQRLVALALDQLGRGCGRPRSARRCRASAPGAPSVDEVAARRG